MSRRLPAWLRAPHSSRRDEGHGCVVLLNLDAEHELAQNTRWRRSAAMVERIRQRAADLAPAIRAVWPGAELSVPAARAGERADRMQQQAMPEPQRPPAVRRGFAWCPTPSASAGLAACGARLPARLTTDVAVLRGVNDRAFVAARGLGRPLPGARFVDDAAAAIARIGRSSPTGRWLLKRALGFAGRQRKIVAAGTDPTAAERRWIEASMTGEYGVGVQIEPFVERRLDLAVHGHVAAEARRPGDTATFGVRIADCDAAGRWLAGRAAHAGELPAEVATAMRDEAWCAADALAAAGYTGPFSIDGFVWTGGDGRPALQTCADLNARFTMDWWAACASAPAD